MNRPRCGMTTPRGGVLDHPGVGLLELRGGPGHDLRAFGGCLGDLMCALQRRRVEADVREQVLGELRHRLAVAVQACGFGR